VDDHRESTKREVVVVRAHRTPGPVACVAPTCARSPRTTSGRRTSDSLFPRTVSEVMGLVALQRVSQCTSIVHSNACQRVKPMSAARANEMGHRSDEGSPANCVYFFFGLWWR
jgi:hypothetical protein